MWFSAGLPPSRAPCSAALPPVAPVACSLAHGSELTAVAVGASGYLQARRQLDKGAEGEAKSGGKEVARNRAVAHITGSEQGRRRSRRSRGKLGSRRRGGSFRVVGMVAVLARDAEFPVLGQLRAGAVAGARRDHQQPRCPASQPR